MLNYQQPDNMLHKLMIFYGYFCLILTDKKRSKSKCNVSEFSIMTA